VRVGNETFDFAPLSWREPQHRVTCVARIGLREPGHRVSGTRVSGVIGSRAKLKPSYRKVSEFDSRLTHPDSTSRNQHVEI